VDFEMELLIKVS